MIAAKFEKILAFNQVFFSVSTKSVFDDITNVTSGSISDTVKVCMESFLTQIELENDIGFSC